MRYPTGDTYSEIENGEVVDYYCHNGQKYNTHPIGLEDGPTCLISYSYRSVINTTTYVIRDDSCSTQPAFRFIVCDPYP